MSFVCTIVMQDDCMTSRSARVVGLSELWTRSEHTDCIPQSDRKVGLSMGGVLHRTGDDWVLSRIRNVYAQETVAVETSTGPSWLGQLDCFQRTTTFPEGFGEEG